jgi:hypothetical protein
MTAPRVFLLSPASTGGKRAALLRKDTATNPLALAIRAAAGAPLGDVFAFLSSLYFRGKLGYALSFARPPEQVPGTLIITSSRGLLEPQTSIRLEDLNEFSTVDIDATEPRYADPFRRDAVDLAGRIGAETEVVLLGSVASDKYVGILGEIFGGRLLFPADFVGRGDMSRGGLMLRCVREGRELDYVPVLGAVRHGGRPPRLEPIKARR